MSTPSSATAHDVTDPGAHQVLGTGVARVNSCEGNELAPKIQMTTVRNNASLENYTPTTVPAPQKQYFGVLGQRHVICITGLPNNGKKFVAQELGWYLEFFYGTRVNYFRVEDYAHHGSKEANARALLQDVQSFLRITGGIGRSPSSKAESEDGSFARRRRENTDSGRVAIVLPPQVSSMAALDDDQAKEAWSSTWSCTNALDRNWVRKRLGEAHEDYKLMFIEIELTDRSLLKQHDRALERFPKQKRQLEDLRDWYEGSYTPLGRSASSESSLSFLKYRNFRDMQTHRMHGYLRMRVAQFLSVLRPWKHTVFLSRHGESTYNIEKKLGGDPKLSAAGEEFARRLGVFATKCIQVNPRSGKFVAARLWTSSLQRTELTAEHIPHPDLYRDDLEQPTESMLEAMEYSDVHPTNVHPTNVHPTESMLEAMEYSHDQSAQAICWKQMRHRVFRNLDEIYAGTFDGMTEKQIAAVDARFGADRKVDKLATRYPHGESYLDIMTRLEPLVLELHSYQEPLLIVSHQATLRVLRAYLLRDRSLAREMCPTIDIPQHTVMKVTWDAWNFNVTAAELEQRMKAKVDWPPSEAEKWSSSDADALLGQPEPHTGAEEWFWLGPDPKRCDGQRNL